jgi:hypothetical protein
LKNSDEYKKLESLLCSYICKKIVTRALKKLNSHSSDLRKNRVIDAITPKTYREFFYPKDVGDEIYMYKKVQELDVLGVISIEHGIKRTSAPLYDRKTKLIFNLEYEKVCRDILGIKSESSSDIWKEVVHKSSLSIEMKDVLIRGRLIAIKGKNSQEIVDSIEKHYNDAVGKERRQASAILFWSISKVLDARPELCKILHTYEMPIQILAYTTSNSTEQLPILMIENQKTFQLLSEDEHLSLKYLLIYTAGFEASAKRLRVEKGAEIYYGGSSIFLKNEIESWLVCKSQWMKKVMFWGDLDLSGLNIFASLKKQFPELTFYVEAYNEMIKIAQQGDGHNEKMSAKEGQVIFNHVDKNTISFYVDIIENNGLVDQEAVLVEILKNVDIDSFST